MNIKLLSEPSRDNRSQPQWVAKVPDGYMNDYYVGRGVSWASKTEALQLALEDAIGSIIKNGRISVQLAENFTEHSTEELQDGQSKELNVISKIAREVKIEGSSRIIMGLREVETYTEENGNYFDAYVLVSIPKAHPITPPNSFSPVWRSLLVPGWGQLYKDQTFKGISFMTLTVGGIAGGFILKQLQTDATNKAFSARTQARRDFYNARSKNFNTYSTISFIVSGVVYCWNLADALIVKNDNLYVRLNKKDDLIQMQFSLNF